MSAPTDSPGNAVTYEVSVTVQCSCTIMVTASSPADAVTKARAAYDRGDCDVDDPFSADWLGVEVERKS